MFTVSHDYYGILGVSKNAIFEEIRRQYRELAKEHNPNRYIGLANKYRALGDEDLLRVCEDRIAQETEFMKLLNEAFEVLSDPVKRKQYDGQVVEPSAPLPEISIRPTRIAFGSLLEGQEKSLAFTIENKGGPPTKVHIDWEGDKPDWGEIIIEPDAENVFPIKVTVKVDTTSIPSGPKDEKILVDVDGRIHIVEVFLAVTSPTVASTTPTRTSPPPIPPAEPTLWFKLAILGAILVFVAIVIGSMVKNVSDYLYRPDQQTTQAKATETAVAYEQQQQLLEATTQAQEATVQAEATAAVAEQQQLKQEFAIGARVVVTDTGGSGLNMRSGAGTGLARVKTLPDGTVLEIIDGPREADGHTWYQVRDGVGTTGWIIVRFIRLQ